MCGICGFTSSLDLPLLKRMTSILAHRGPDDCGYFQEVEIQVNLGHRRLSIIDPAAGTQPMISHCKNYVIIFNGEIYNFQELRKELGDRGRRFRTRSDTEVLLESYIEYGPEIFYRLNGIFAAAILDRRNRKIVLFRDHFGVKPLHYFVSNTTLVFASESKSLLLHPAVKREPDFESLHYFMNVKFVPGTGTLFKSVRRLEAGHWLEFDVETGKKTVHRFFSPLDLYKKEPMSVDEAVEGIRHHLRNAVKRQLVSDVPLGAYLSGGMDSSAIVAMMRQEGTTVESFSLGFHEPTDEVSDARKVAQYFETNHHESMTSLEPLRTLPKTIWFVEEPKVNILQGFILSEFARRNITVALSGLGGDELFAGYNNYRLLYPLDILRDYCPSLSPALACFLKKFLIRNNSLKSDFFRRGFDFLSATRNKSLAWQIQRNVWDYDPSFTERIYSAEIQERVSSWKTGTLFEGFFNNPSTSLTADSLVCELATKLPCDFLLNEDRTSMAHSLEVRVPFLDIDLVKFAFRIPVEYKIRGNTTRWIYRKAMEGLLPPLCHRKPKWGFAINPYHQFRKDLRLVAEKILTPDRVQQHNIFNYAYIRSILDHPPHPRLRWHYFHLWMMVGFSIWFDMFFQNDIENPTFELEDYYA